jgi:hypothetical protein
MKAVALVLLAGCAAARPPSQLAAIFEQSEQPFGYRADIGAGAREVRGEACRSAIGLPLFVYGGEDLVGWGEAGYRDAMAQAQAQAPAAALSDVRADLKLLNVLVFRRECIEVVASAR